MSQDLPRPTGPVVGFDLDMTLIDTAPGFGEVLRVLGRELGVDFPVSPLSGKWISPNMQNVVEIDGACSLHGAGEQRIQFIAQRLETGA